MSSHKNQLTTIRKWSYALIFNRDSLEDVFVVLKSRWPFEWKYDLIWWGEEGDEDLLECFKRELKEETDHEWDMKAFKWLWTFDYESKHEWEWQNIHELWICQVFVGSTQLDISKESGSLDVYKIISTPFSKLNELELWPTLRQIIERYTPEELLDILKK